MRIVAAMMKHETNTFSPLPTPLAAFEADEPGAAPVAGAPAIERYAGTNTGLAAYIELARREGVS